MKTKLYILVLFALLAVLTLSGCGGTTTSTPAIPTATADVPTPAPTSLPADVTATVLEPPGSPTASNTAQPSGATPEEAINSFYNWYIAQNPSPLVSGSYKTSPYITDDLIQQVTTQLMSATSKSLADPFLCSLNTPTGFTVDPASVSGDQATTIIHTENGADPGSNLNLTLQMEKSQWKISAIRCLLGQ